MLQSGWTPGTALGASSIPTPASEGSAAKVKITIKDDTLGLGASLKSRNVEHQRTGLDAFQGLLGRLNAKDAAELKAAEERVENKKLAMFALGRWGGMVFVPGGKLVQDDPTEQVPKPERSADEKEVAAEIDKEVEESESEAEEQPMEREARRKENETPEERAKRKAEKKQRKEERRVRREERRLRKLQKENRSGTSTSVSGTQTPDLTETSTGASTPVLLQELDNGNSSVSVTAVTQHKLSNGRHLLRGRNIQAKRLAFSDARGLDQIFMRQAQKMEV